MGDDSEKVRTQVLALGLLGRAAALAADGQNFTIGKRWLRAALAQLPSTLLKPIVSESKYVHNERAKIHLGDLLTALAFLTPKRKLVSYLFQAPKLAHGVS